MIYKSYIMYYVCVLCYVYVYYVTYLVKNQLKFDFEFYRYHRKERAIVQFQNT